MVPSGQAFKLRVGARSSTLSIQEAIAAAVDLPPGSFGLVTMDGTEGVPIEAALLQPGQQYKVRQLRTSQNDASPAAWAEAPSPHLLRPPPPPPPPSQAAAERGARGGSVPVEGIVDKGVVLSGRPAVLPRVIIACLGTGRYRELAIGALQSAREKFGGDCRLSLHLLTDDVEGVEREFNPAFAPYREWQVY